MKTFTIEAGRDFHNAGPLDIKVREDSIFPRYVSGERVPGKMALLTRAQVRRIDKHFCGFTDCTCGSSPVVEENSDGQFYVYI